MFSWIGQGNVDLHCLVSWTVIVSKKARICHACNHRRSRMRSHNRTAIRAPSDCGRSAQRQGSPTPSNHGQSKIACSHLLLPSSVGWLRRWNDPSGSPMLSHAGRDARELGADVRGNPHLRAAGETLDAMHLFQKTFRSLSGGHGGRP